MTTRQVRIFVPPTEGKDWDVTLLGRVIRPLTREFDFEWFWFSRYEMQVGEKWEERNDCEYDKIPAAFKFLPDSTAGHRSLRFRFATPSEWPGMETRFWNIMGQYGYAATDIRYYDQIGDTGSHRFLGVEHRDKGMAGRRAEKVTNLYHAAAELVLDALVGPDRYGRYRMEHNDLAQNPTGSTFDSLLHVVENITAAYPPQPKVEPKKGKAK